MQRPTGDDGDGGPKVRLSRGISKNKMQLDHLILAFALVASFIDPIAQGQQQQRQHIPKTQSRISSDDDNNHKAGQAGIQTIIEYVDDAGRQLVLDTAKQINVDAGKFYFLSAELQSDVDIEVLRRNPHIRSVERDVDDPIFEAVPFGDYLEEGDSDDGGIVHKQRRRIEEIIPFVDYLEDRERPSDDDGVVHKQWRRMEEMTPDAVTIIQAHQLEMGPDPPTICIADSGYALGHPDLPEAPQVQGTNMELSNGRVLRWDKDRTGHGTESASIIAAVEGNDQGLRGASPGVRLHITRGLDDDNRSTVSQMFRSIQQCVDAGAQIINLSIGCPCEDRDDPACLNTGCVSSQIERYFANLHAGGILVVAAAGNQGKNVGFYPASYPAVVSVGASNRRLSKIGESNSNAQVELMGLGFAVSVLGVDKSEQDWHYSFREITSGTSVATSGVAAAAALLWSNFPQCNVTQIRTALGRTAINVHGCDTNTGFGLVQVKDARDLLITEGCELDGRLYHGGDSCDAEFLKTEAPTSQPVMAPSNSPSPSPSVAPTLSESPTLEPSQATEEPTVSDLDLMSSNSRSTSDASVIKDGFSLCLLLLSVSISVLLLR